MIASRTAAEGKQPAAIGSRLSRKGVLMVVVVPPVMVMAVMLVTPMMVVMVVPPMIVLIEVMMVMVAPMMVVMVLAVADRLRQPRLGFRKRSQRGSCEA
jgi:hypothetical protein